MTGTAVPLIALVRKVCTGTQVVHAAPPVREESTVPLTTRTYIDSPALPLELVSEYTPPAPVTPLVMRLLLLTRYNSTRTPAIPTPFEAANERPSPPP